MLICGHENIWTLEDHSAQHKAIKANWEVKKKSIQNDPA